MNCLVEGQLLVARSMFLSFYMTIICGLSLSLNTHIGPFNNLVRSRIRLPEARKYYNKRNEEITRAAMEFAGIRILVTIDVSFLLLLSPLYSRSDEGRHAPDGYQEPILEDSRFDPRYDNRGSTTGGYNLYICIYIHYA